MKLSVIVLLTLCVCIVVSTIQSQESGEFDKLSNDPTQNKKLLYVEDFDFEYSNWRVEFQDEKSSFIEIIEGKLDIKTSQGATVWFKYKLKGNTMITYDVTVIDNGGKYDRVSDMNVFWMATDPLNKNGILRDGEFSSYDDLNLYYAGVGGHNNTFTRFRKYRSDGFKPVLQEYTDAAYLLLPNINYQIKIIVCNGLIRFFRNNKLFWELNDKEPYTEGYFAFRTTMSHQQFDNFRVYQLLNCD